MEKSGGAMKRACKGEAYSLYRLFYLIRFGCQKSCIQINADRLRKRIRAHSIARILLRNLSCNSFKQDFLIPEPL